MAKSPTSGDFFVLGYFVYILFSETLNTYYKGFTTDVEKRLYYHLNSQRKFTSKSSDREVVYVRRFTTKKEALVEERRLNRLNRISLEKLIG
ncbi:MAG: GIY-YIG nuclease family protein [Chryseobacterium sp.]|nr:MAG: GIY-YIG nuclease family protein [Chryseobacterium sp.]